MSRNAQSSRSGRRRFNTFNHTNFSLPNSTVGTAIAGTISSTVVGPGGSSARVLQLAAKVDF